MLAQLAAHSLRKQRLSDCQETGEDKEEPICSITRSSLERNHDEIKFTVVIGPPGIISTFTIVPLKIVFRNVNVH